MATRTATSEGAIGDRLLRPDRGDLSPEAARFFLKLKFDPHDRDRHELVVGNQEGALSLSFFRPFKVTARAGRA